MTAMEVTTLQPVTYDDYEIEAFWSKVEILESSHQCWEWQGATNGRGYGHLRIRNQWRNAHSFVWEITCFPVPTGFQVCHICDNPSCCNPNHLMLGNAGSNSSDMILKGRDGFKKNRAIGLRNTNAKLTWDEVCEIRRLYANNSYNQYELAAQFGVSQTSIGSIVRYETRKEA